MALGCSGYHVRAKLWLMNQSGKNRLLDAFNGDEFVRFTDQRLWLITQTVLARLSASTWHLNYQRNGSTTRTAGGSSRKVLNHHSTWSKSRRARLVHGSSFTPQGSVAICAQNGSSEASGLGALRVPTEEGPRPFAGGSPSLPRPTWLHDAIECCDAVLTPDSLNESAAKSRGGKRRNGNVSAADPVRGGARRGTGDPGRHRARGRGDGAQDPAYRVRVAPRWPAIPRPAGGPLGAHGDQEQGALAEDAAQGEPATGRRERGCQGATRYAGRDSRRAALIGNRARAGSGLTVGTARTRRRERE